MALARSNFIWMLTGRSMSKLGDTFSFLALMLMIYERTGSALSVGHVMLTTFLPGILLGPLIGVFADRLNKRKMALVAEVLRAAVLIAIPFVPTLGWLYVLTFLSATIGNISRTAQGALLPEVFPKEEMLSYNAKIRSTVEIMGVAGPVAAGFVIGIWSYEAAFFFDGATFLYSALTLALLRLTPRSQKSENLQHGGKPAFFTQLREGAAYMRKQPRILNAVGIIFVTMIVSGMFNVLFVVFSRDVIGVTSQQFGFLEAALGLGFATGAALMSRFKDVDPLRYVRGAAVMNGFLFLALGFVQDFYTELVVVMLLGIVSVMAMVAGPTLLQTESDPAYIGRVMGFFQTLFSAGTALSMALAGVVESWLGVRDVLLYGGALVVVCSLLLSLRKLPKQEQRALAS